MGDEKESTAGKGKMMTYVRRFFLTTIGLLLLITVIMAIYRKVGG